jgi:hypothetical protein
MKNKKKNQATSLLTGESVFCLMLAVAAAASVHRVSATTCLIFSIMMLYSINKISQKVTLDYCDLFDRFDLFTRRKNVRYFSLVM